MNKKDIEWVVKHHDSNSSRIAMLENNVRQGNLIMYAFFAFLILALVGLSLWIMTL